MEYTESSCDIPSCYRHQRCPTTGVLWLQGMSAAGHISHEIVSQFKSIDACEFGAYNRKEDDNGRDDKPSVKSSCSDIVVRAPPAVESFLDEVVENQREDSPGRERQRRRRWQPAHCSQHNWCMERAADPAQAPAVFDKGVENARKDRSNHPKDVEILIYGTSSEHPVRADDSPDNR